MGSTTRSSPSMRSTDHGEEAGKNASQETHVGIPMPASSRLFIRSGGNQECGQD